MTIEADIKNYYEQLVVDEVLNQAKTDGFEEADYEDIACVALNNLPPRYYRHSVDMAFYLSPQEQQDMSDKVTEAVASALKLVKEHRSAT